MKIRTFVFFGLVLTAAPVFLGAEENKPWSFWARTDEKDTGDLKYEGKPRIEPPQEIIKKRETQEDLREHTQRELAKADLTTEQGRRDWEQKKRDVRQKRMEELKQEKRAKTEEVKKLRGDAAREERKKKAKAESGAVPSVPAPGPKIQTLELPASGTEGGS